MKKRSKEMRKIQHTIILLATDQVLPASYKDHALIGDFSGFRDCHIEPDWILVYKKENISKEYPEGLLSLELT
jgi:mRNA interferase YafQ